MTTYVYKITREDDKEYIGITVNCKRRFSYHRNKNSRFKIGIKKIEILAECNSYEEAEDLEDYYIEKFDTYENGLNLTPNGKGLNDGCKFNTLGHVFSDESRKKMSDSAKKRGSNTTGFKFDKDTKEKLSNIRKGKYWGKRKIDNAIALKIYESYRKKELTFNENFVKQFVKKSQQNILNEIDIKELKAPNGKPLSIETLYANYYAQKYNVTPQAIRLILKKKGKMSPNYDEV